MAQDVHVAFGLGDSEKSIAAIDADGIALAAIQGLLQVVKENESKIAAQHGQIKELEERLAGLEKRLK
jgi:hypothetical protein